jgi:hypothetical protein
VSEWNQKLIQSPIWQSSSSWNQRSDRQSSISLNGRQAKRKQAREAIELACLKDDPTLERPFFDEPRAYLDDKRWYTTCVPPLPHEEDFIPTEARAFVATKIADKIVDSVFSAGSDRVDPPLQEPRKPPDPADHGPIDSGCNLPVTNPQAVAHFGLETFAWTEPKWIKFGNGKRECSTHYAYFGPIIGQVAILASAPDTLISVAVLCLKGLEVSFKIPGGAGIYLQGVLLHQGTVDPVSHMFYVNIRDLLSMSIKFQDPKRFAGVVTDSSPIPSSSTASSESSCLAGKRSDAISPDKIRQVLWLHKRLGWSSQPNSDDHSDKGWDLDWSATRHYPRRC